MAKTRLKLVSPATVKRTVTHAAPTVSFGHANTSPSAKSRS